MSERGSAPVELALGVGALLIPVVLVLAMLPPMLEHRAVARTAAAEAARVLVLGDGSASSHAEARQVAGRVVADYPSAEVATCGGTCVLERGGVVEVTVRLEVPLDSVPLVGDIAGFVVSASHREQVDAYRSFP